jgi:hypothetical protein
MTKVFKVEHYETVVDKDKYPNEGVSSKYKTRVREKRTDYGSVLHDVSVRYSEHDTQVAANWRERDLVALEEDGNGLKVTFSGRQYLYLNYSNAQDLMLALYKFHSLQGYGKLQPYRKEKK